jgi:hypothetical protein
MLAKRTFVELEVCAMLTSVREGARNEASRIEPQSALTAVAAPPFNPPSSRVWLIAALLIVAISLAPLLVVEVPAVLDYPNHLARFFVLAHSDDAILAKMYAPHWAILPNLGIDILGRALLSLLPANLGGRILLGLSLIAPLAGATVYARAAFGRWTGWSLGVGVIGFNAIFFLGFMNFLLGLGIALGGAGVWRAWRRAEHPIAAGLGGAIVGLLAFFCHVLGFAFFGLLIAADEAEGLIRLLKQGRLTGKYTLTTVATLAAALGPALILYGLTHHAAPAGGEWIAWNWDAKLLQVLVPFMAYDQRVTSITLVVVASIIVLVWRRSQRASGVTLALVMLGGIYLAAPCSVAGGTFVDARLPLMGALVIFAGLAPSLPPRTGMAVATAFALLIAGRSAHVAANWQGRARDLADLRSTLAHIEPGSKILPAETDSPTTVASGNGRVLPKMARLDEHLGALAVLERRAFWPLLFHDPTQQPLIVKPPYDRIAAPLGPPSPWRLLFADAPTRRDVAQFPFLADWRERFDYVLVMGPRPMPGMTPRGLSLIRAGDAASLYRIDHTQVVVARDAI